MVAAGTMEQRLALLYRRRSGNPEDQITAPIAALRKIHGLGDGADEIRIRLPFIRRVEPLIGDIPEHGPDRKKDLPPAGRLGESSSRGVALPTALMLLFAANQEPPRSHPRRRRYWPLPLEATTSERVGLVDLVAPLVDQRDKRYRNTTQDQLRIRRVKTALNAMARAEVSLIDLPAGKGYARERFENPGLLMETGPRRHGSALRYERPGPGEEIISVPAALFLSGWVHLLTKSELLCWLMFRAEAVAARHRFPTSTTFQLGAVERLAHYGLTKDVWDTHQMLNELGILTHTPDPNRRPDGTMPEFSKDDRGNRHIFAFNDAALSTDTALDQVIEAVRNIR